MMRERRGSGLGLLIVASSVLFVFHPVQHAAGKAIGAVAHVFSSSGSSCSGIGSVPAGEINGAAKAIGISCKVVRAQINEESGGDPSVTSSMGAQGVAQFMPGTWRDDGCAGSPFNVSDAMACYVVQMRGDLRAEGGNLRLALAAYNAGTGNTGAGLGYADTIMAAS